MSRTRLYRDGVLVKEDVPAAEVSSRLAADDRAVAWLDLCQPTAEELTGVAEQFGLHRLAVEDVTQEKQRVKLDRYDTHMFLSTLIMRLHPGGGLAAQQLAAFITPRVLITVRKENSIDLDDLLQRWDENRELARHGVSFLLYGLLDVLVDDHFRAVQNLDSAIESIDDRLFVEPDTSRVDIQRRILRARRDLVNIRQIVLPMREVVNALMRPTLHTVDPEMIPYYQDVYDHVLQAIEWVDSLRDLITTMLDTNLAVQSNHLNQIVKQVTSWAAIIAVPAAITGFFGQNVRIPLEHTTGGLLLSLAVTVGFGVALYAVFRRKGWL